MGGGTPVHPGLDMHTLAPPLEPEAGSNILNLHIYSDFFLFLSIDNATICPFYDNMIYLKKWNIFLKDFYSFTTRFYNGMIGNYGKVINSHVD